MCDLGLGICCRGCADPSSSLPAPHLAPTVSHPPGVLWLLHALWLQPGRGELAGGGKGGPASPGAGEGLSVPPWEGGGFATHIKMLAFPLGIPLGLQGAARGEGRRGREPVFLYPPQTGQPWKAGAGKAGCNLLAPAAALPVASLSCP